MADKVKALVWRKIESGEHYVSETLWRSDYWINKSARGAESGMFVADFTDISKTPWRFPALTLDAAKAACQEHHNLKIASLYYEAVGTIDEPLGIGNWMMDYALQVQVEFRIATPELGYPLSEALYASIAEWETATGKDFYQTVADMA